MAYYAATPFVPQFVTDAGVPLAGGTLTAYIAGTSTLTNMYTDDDGTVAGTTVSLNARGEPNVSGNPVVIWLDESVEYKFVLKDGLGVSKWTIDSIYSAAGRLQVRLTDADDASNGAGMVGYRGRSVRAKLDEVVSVLDFTGASHGARILNALTYLDGAGGGTLRINRGQTFLVEESIISPVLSGDIDIIFEPGSKLVAAPGLDVPVLHMRASTSAITDRILRIQNPVIDCSAGETVGATQSCTAISAQYFRSLVVDNPMLYGGEDPRNSNADSGITPICCDYVTVTGGRIRGFSDAGIYIGGDNTSGTVGDGVTATIRGVAIERCFQAVVAKRDQNHLRVVNNTIIECVSGVIAAEITTPSYTNPVRRLDVVGNRFFRLGSQAARFRGPTKGMFANNLVEDWGYEYDGTTPVSGSAYALVIQGSSGIDVKGNEFKRNLWASNDQRAVLLDNVTLNGTPYTQGKHYFANNSYRNIPRVYVEAAGGDASFYINEYFQNISTGIQSGLHADSVLIYQQDGSPRQWIYAGGMAQPVTRGALVARTTNLTLNASDSGGQYSNAGATGAVTITLPAASPGLTFTFRCMASQNLVVQAASGDVIRVGASQSTSGGTATANGAGQVLTLTAMDSTNWVADSSTGTWTLSS